MAKNDKSLFDISDLARAASLLSRLPLGRAELTGTRSMADSAWVWPLIGALLGALAGLVGLAGHWLGLPASISAALSLAALIALSGALHEDGLADTFDGLWGGHERARRLEIMRDSRVGTYGVLALVLALLLRWSALVALLEGGWFLAPLIGASLLSRVPMVLLMANMANAREAGLAAGSGIPAPRTAMAALAIALGLAVLLLGWWALLAAAFWIALFSLALGALAKARIGGLTGDILGASQQVSEIAALVVFATLLA